MPKHILIHDWQPRLAWKSRDEIRAVQEQLLRESIAYVGGYSLYYRRLWGSLDINAADIRTLDDLKKLPITTKDDLQRNNDQFHCVTPLEVADWVTTSGTLGAPVTIAMTEGDLQRLAYNERMSYETCGCTDHDIVQLTVTLDRRFMAGLACWLGAREMNLGICRVGSGLPAMQWETASRIKPSVLMCVPSFILKLIDYAQQNNIDWHHSSFNRGCCVGEALHTPDGKWTKLGERINQLWPELELYTNYASTEMQTSFCDCAEHHGAHLKPELIVVELLDDEGRDVPNGQIGEVTITTLGVEGTPLVRFRTGDMAILDDSPCACGRNTPRLSSIVGRKGQMIKYKGTTLYPPAIFDILDGVEGLDGYYVEVSTNDVGTDELTVCVAARQPSEAFEKTVKDRFRAQVRVAPDVRFVNLQNVNEHLASGGRKLTKFFDLR